MIGLLPDTHKTKPGIGIAMKFSDGDPDRRATFILVTAVLRAFGYEAQLESEAYLPFANREVRNWRGLTAGEKRVTELVTAALARLPRTGG